MSKILVECWERCTREQWDRLRSHVGMVLDERVQRIRLPVLTITAKDGLTAAKIAAGTYGYTSNDWFGPNPSPRVVIRCTDLSQEG